MRSRGMSVSAPAVVVENAASYQHYYYCCCAVGEDTTWISDRGIAAAALLLAAAAAADSVSHETWKRESIVLSTRIRPCYWNVEPLNLSLSSPCCCTPPCDDDLPAPLPTRTSTRCRIYSNYSRQYTQGMMFVSTSTFSRPPRSPLCSFEASTDECYLVLKMLIIYVTMAYDYVMHTKKNDGGVHHPVF